MRTITLLIAVASILSSCQINRDAQVLLIDNLPEAKTGYQRTIVGHLSGAYELARKTRIKSRWSKEERALTGKLAKSQKRRNFR